MDFHGQHDTYGLLNVAEHRAIFDSACGNTSLLEEMQQRFSSIQQHKQNYNSYVNKNQLPDEERVRLQFRFDELESINPLLGEDEHVAQELRRVEQSEQVVQQATSLKELVYSSDVSAYITIKNAQKLLGSLTHFDSDLERFIPDLESASIVCQEVAFAIALLLIRKNFLQNA